MVVIIRDAASEGLSTVRGTVKCPANSLPAHLQALSILTRPLHYDFDNHSWKGDFPPKLQRDLSAMDVKKLLFLKCQLPYDKNHFRIYEEEIGK